MVLLFIWILSFLVGAILEHALVSSSTKATLFIIPPGIMAVMILARLKTKRPLFLVALFIGAAAIFWGCHHHGSVNAIDMNQKNIFTVITANAYGQLGRYLQISNGAEILSVKGKSSKGAVGYVECRNKKHGRCRWRSIAQFKPVKQNVLWSVTDAIRQLLEFEVANTTKTLSLWMQSLIFSKPYLLDRSIILAMKDTGIYHLMVISGFHVGLIFAFFKAFFRAPFFILYCTGLMRARLWPIFYQICALAVIPVGFVCLTAISLTPSSSRAFLLFATYEIVKLSLGNIGGVRLVAVTGVLQTVLFPSGLIDHASLLSWGSFLVLKFGPSYSFASIHQIYGRMASLCLKQILIMLLNITVFGSFSWISLFANLLFVPLFPVVFFLSVFALAVDWGWLVSIVSDLLDYYWLAMQVLSEYANVIEVSPGVKNIVGLFLCIGPMLGFSHVRSRS
jgi:hypothetical protein